MKTVLIVGAAAAVVVWLIAFFNVHISHGGNEERTFNGNFFIIATVVATIVTSIVAYKTALNATINEFDSHLMPYESGVWSLIGTALVFLCFAVMYGLVVYCVAEWIQNHREVYFYGLQERIEKKLRHEYNIKYDKKYGDELERLHELEELHGFRVPDAPNLETLAFLKQHDAEVEAQRAAEAARIAEITEASAETEAPAETTEILQFRQAQ